MEDDSGGLASLVLMASLSRFRDQLAEVKPSGLGFRVWFLVLSAGPKTRVPRGLPSLVILKPDILICETLELQLYLSVQHE